MPRLGASDRLRIVVLGYIVRGPLAGHAWHHLHYVAGLAALGHDVWFLEDSDDYPRCYNPVSSETGVDPSYGLAFTARAFARIGLPQAWAYHDAHSGSWHGPAAAEILEVCRGADIVLNLSGANPLRPWLLDIPVRVFIDTDPGFTQAENINSEAARDRVLQHTAFHTFAELVGKGAALPDDGIAWKPTRQPVALEHWPRTPPNPDGKFTTVMLWESYPPIEVGGIRLGLKAQSFGPYYDLPRRTPHRLEMALGGATAPRETLGENGWSIVDPRTPTRTLESYQSYIGSSLGEFSVAKQGYVDTHSGWFSERSANFLATGRPVITQDTGFSETLPTGSGLFAFTEPEGALCALGEVMLDYERHHRAAREIAEQHFDARAVLSRLLESVFTAKATVERPLVT